MIPPISIISSFCPCGKMMLGAMSSLQSPENIPERYSVFFFLFPNEDKHGIEGCGH